MVNKELRILLNIYFDPDLETKESIAENLREAGIDSAEFISAMREAIERKVAEQKTSGGTEFRRKYKDLLNSLEGNELEKSEGAGMVLAYRDLDELTDEELKDLEEDARKLRILKKLSEDNERNGQS